MIQQASRKAERNPSRAKQARQEARTFAKEISRTRQQAGRLYTSKAQLSSVQTQVNEAFALRRIEGSMKISIGIMKEVNSPTELPGLTGTMNELRQELIKTGIIEEMVGDILGGDKLLGETEEIKEEVEAILNEVAKGKPR